MRLAAVGLGHEGQRGVVALLEPRERAVAGAAVHHQVLVRRAQRGDAVQRLPDVALLVEHRRDDREEAHVGGQCRRGYPAAIRVGFIFNTVNATWLGGLNYFRSLLSAVAEHGSGDIEPVMLVGRGFPATALEGFPEVELRRTGGLDRLHPGWLARGASMMALRHDWPMERTVRAAGIDVISHSVPPGPRGSIPSIAWIPDFQHVHLPEFFSRRELRYRDRHFRALADNATLVLVSSHAAAHDLEEFRPAAKAKSRVLPFVVEPPPREDRAGADEVRRRYGLDGPFFLIANQFWGHKNHLVAIEALALLRERGAAATVATTGDGRDYRAPDVYDTALARAEELGVAGDFRVLGRVDYTDVAGLMEASTALVNPSLFEGWNTGVEEAKSLGVRVVASDIPVHREQDPPGALYFDPHDPEALADAMEEAAATADDDHRRRQAEGAAAALPARRREFALGYEEILREALASR